jgi:hypothetical protein
LGYRALGVPESRTLIAFPSPHGLPLFGDAGEGVAGLSLWTVLSSLSFCSDNLFPRNMSYMYCIKLEEESTTLSSSSHNQHRFGSTASGDTPRPKATTRGGNDDQQPYKDQPTTHTTTHDRRPTTLQLKEDNNPEDQAGQPPLAASMMARYTGGGESSHESTYDLAEELLERHSTWMNLAAPPQIHKPAHQSGW